MNKFWGDYVILAMDQDEKKEQKTKKIKMAVDVLLDKTPGWPIDPDFDTMQIIVHEGWQFTDDGNRFWGMTVALRVQEKEKAGD